MDHQLDFVTFEVDGSSSWAANIRSTGFRSGIYILELIDGTAYVGQSKNLAARLSNHRRNRLGTIASYSLAQCPLEELDIHERLVIQNMEQSGRILVNVMLAHKPRGLEVVSLTMKSGVSVHLPLTKPVLEITEPRPVTTTATPKQQRDIKDARSAFWYDHLISVLATHVRYTIPSASETVGQLWTLSLLPSSNKTRGRRRLATLSAGGLEILRVFYETSEGSKPKITTFLNTDLCTKYAQFSQYRREYRAAKQVSHEYYEYGSAGALNVLICPSGQYRRLITKPLINQLTYSLTVRRMRTGNSVLGARYHHHEFAYDVLMRAYQMPIADRRQRHPGDVISVGGSLRALSTALTTAYDKHHTRVRPR